MKKVSTQLMIGGVCLILGFLLAHQFNLIFIKERNIAQYDTANSYYDVSADIDKLNKLKDQLEKSNDDILSQLKKRETDAASNDEKTKEIKKQLDNTRIFLGSTDVQGDGITLYLTPKTDLFNNTVSQYVNYKDIAYLINELFFAGAEAVSINDDRIILQSVIKSSSNNEFILIDDDKISPKTRIVVKAIGDKNQLYKEINFPEVLNQFSLVSYDIKVEKSDQIKIPKYKKSIKDDFLKPVEK